MPQNVIHINFKRYALGLDKMFGPRVYDTTTIFVDFENRLKIGHI